MMLIMMIANVIIIVKTMMIMLKMTMMTDYDDNYYNSICSRYDINVWVLTGISLGCLDLSLPARTNNTINT